MTEDEKPSVKPFWTWDMIGLVALNVVLVTVIIAIIGVILGQFIPAIAAWLERVFRV